MKALGLNSGLNALFRVQLGVLEVARTKVSWGLGVLRFLFGCGFEDLFGF